MNHDEQTSTVVFSSKSNRISLVLVSLVVCSLLVIAIVCWITIRPSPSTTSLKSLKGTTDRSTVPTTSTYITPSQCSTTHCFFLLASTTSTLSPEEMQRLSTFKEFLNLSSTNPDPNASRSSPNMKQFMRSVYDGMGAKRRKRHDSPLYLSDQVDSILSLPNQSKYQSKRITFQFDYPSSLESLTLVELILPVKHLSTIRLSSSTFNIVLSQPLQIDDDWYKINLTEYVTSFPLTFHLTLTNPREHVAALSSGFLTLQFRRASPVRSARALSSFYDQQPITYPEDPSHCQVRPFRISFAKLHWSAWILEPSSYEMNVCSGTCHTESNMGTYSIIQNLLHQKYPRVMPAPCCRPKRFSSTVLLYYDGPNLVLKRHENMRVVECACSS